MLEKDFQRNVIKWIRKTYPDMWFYKASDRFIAGVPDLVGCYAGRLWAIELKVGDNKPTKLQEFTMGQMCKAGAMVTVAWTLEEVKDFMQTVVSTPCTTLY